MTDTGTRSRALQKAMDTLQSGDFYEAQQLFKTVFHRQRARKQLQDSYATLKDGAVLQLQAGHVTCGVELGLLYCDTMMQDGVPPSQDSMAVLLQLVAAFPSPNDQAGRRDTARAGAAPAPAAATATGAAGSQGAGGSSSSTGAGQLSDVEEFVRLMGAASSWASKMPHLSWQPMQQLHAAFATYLWQEYGVDQLARVCQHVVRGNKPALHIQVLRAATPPGAMDVFLTQAVLKVLAAAKTDTKASQLDHARALWAALAPATASSPLGATGTAAPGGSEGQYPPLTNFLGLLLEAVDRRSLPLVKLLRDRYAPSLRIDPGWSALLDRIEAAYMGAKGRGLGGGAMAGLLGQLMQGLGPGMEEELLMEEEGGQEGPDTGPASRAGAGGGDASRPPGPSVRIDEVDD